jgi:glycosyltransferase involved in cell wall biosynthesis
MIPDEGLPGVLRMARAAVELIRRDEIDVVVCSVPGFSPWLAALLAARRTGAPVVVDYRDLWHGDVLRTWVGLLRSRVELMLERWALSRTDAVVTVSNAKTRFVQHLDRTAERKPFVTIYNGFDNDDLAGITPVRPERDGGRLLLLYTGRLYKHRRIEPLVESLGRLVARGQVRPDEVRLRLLGLIEAQQQRRIDELARRYSLGAVVEAGGYVTRRESLAQQLGADVLVVVVDPGHTADGVLPGKITEYIGLGCFVLAIAPPGEARTLLERYGHAVWAGGDEPARLDAAVQSLVERWRREPQFARRRAPVAGIPTRRENAAQLAALLGEVVHTSARCSTSVISSANFRPGILHSAGRVPRQAMPADA